MITDILQRIRNVFTQYGSWFRILNLNVTQRLIDVHNLKSICHPLSKSLIKLDRLHRRIAPTISSLWTKFCATLHHFQWQIGLISFFRPPPKPSNNRLTPLEEERYWKEAEDGQGFLRQTDARWVGADRPKNQRVPDLPPLVMYYVPALLPHYRDQDKEIKAMQEKNAWMMQLDPEEYCQWHRMVFPHSEHPDEEDAMTLIPLHSAAERRKMREMSGLLPHASYRYKRRLFQPKYQAMWDKWLQTLAARKRHRKQKKTEME